MQAPVSIFVRRCWDVQDILTSANADFDAAINILCNLFHVQLALQTEKVVQLTQQLEIVYPFVSGHPSLAKKVTDYTLFLRLREKDIARCRRPQDVAACLLQHALHEPTGSTVRVDAEALCTGVVALDHKTSPVELVLEVLEGTVAGKDPLGNSNDARVGTASTAVSENVLVVRGDISKEDMTETQAMGEEKPLGKVTPDIGANASLGNDDEGILVEKGANKVHCRSDADDGDTAKSIRGDDAAPASCTDDYVRTTPTVDNLFEGPPLLVQTRDLMLSSTPGGKTSRVLLRRDSGCTDVSSCGCCSSDDGRTQNHHACLEDNSEGCICCTSGLCGECREGLCRASCRCCRGQCADFSSSERSHRLSTSERSHKLSSSERTQRTQHGVVGATPSPREWSSSDTLTTPRNADTHTRTPTSSTTGSSATQSTWSEVENRSAAHREAAVNPSYLFARRFPVVSSYGEAAREALPWEAEITASSWLAPDFVLAGLGRVLTVLRSVDLLPVFQVTLPGDIRTISFLANGSGAAVVCRGYGLNSVAFLDFATLAVRATDTPARPAVSPSGSVVACPGARGAASVRLYSMLTRSRLQNLSCALGPETPKPTMATTAASNCAAPERSDYSPTVVAFDSTGTRVLVGGRTGSMVVCDTRTGKVRQLGLPLDEAEGIEGSPGARKCAEAGAAKTNNSLLRTSTSTPAACVDTILVCPHTGRLLTCASDVQKSWLRVWDPETFAQLGGLETCRVDDLCFGPLGQVLLVSDCAFYAWDYLEEKGGDELQLLHVGIGEKGGCSYDPVRGRVFWILDRRVQVWSLSKPNVTCGDCNDGASCEGDYSDRETGDLEKAFGSKLDVRDHADAQQGSYPSSDPVYHKFDRGLARAQKESDSSLERSRYDLDHGAAWGKISKKTLGSLPVFHNLRGITLSPDGSHFASWGTHEIALHSTRSGALLRTFPSHAAPVACGKFHPSGTWFVSADLNGTLSLWDVNSGVLEGTLYQDRACTSVAFVGFCGGYDATEVVAAVSRPQQKERDVRTVYWRPRALQCLLPGPSTRHSPTTPSGTTAEWFDIDGWADALAHHPCGSILVARSLHGLGCFLIPKGDAIDCTVAAAALFDPCDPSLLDPSASGSEPWDVSCAFLVGSEGPWVAGDSIASDVSDADDDDDYALGAGSALAYGGEALDAFGAAPGSGGLGPAASVRGVKKIPGMYNGGCFSPDGRFAAVYNRWERLTVWACDPDGHFAGPVLEVRGEVMACTFSPTSDSVAVAVGCTIQVWRLEELEAEAEVGAVVPAVLAMSPRAIEACGGARALASSPQNAVRAGLTAPLLRRGAQGNARAFSGKWVLTLCGHVEAVSWVEWASRWLLSGSNDGSLRLWDMRTLLAPST